MSSQTAGHLDRLLDVRSFAQITIEYQLDN